MHPRVQTVRLCVGWFKRKQTDVRVEKSGKEWKEAAYKHLHVKRVYRVNSLG